MIAAVGRCHLFIKFFESVSVLLEHQQAYPNQIVTRHSQTVLLRFLIVIFDEGVCVVHPLFLLNIRCANFHQ